MRPWDDHETNRLRQLARQRLTARQIGEILDRSRNAVIGKCDRERIPLLCEPVTAMTREQRSAAGARGNAVMRANRAREAGA